MLLGRVILLLGLLAFVNTGSAVAKRGEAKIDFEKQIKPLLNQYCYSCHGDTKKKGDLSLEDYQTEAVIIKDPHVWEKVLHNVRTAEMPPAKKPQPKQTERDLIAAWIESEVFKVDCDNPDPGRVTLRRLNRAEYNNTIRDLVGVNFQPAADFPTDDSGYGFDNNGDVLSLSPILLEKYMAAAEKILNAAIISQPNTNGPVVKYPARKLEVNVSGGRYRNGYRLGREGELFTRFQFPKDGIYIFRTRAFGEQAGPEPARMELRLDDKVLQTFDVKAVENAPAFYEFRVPVTAGERRVATAYINNYNNKNDPDPTNRDRNLIIESLEIIGPAAPQVFPETHKRIFTPQPSSVTKRQHAENIVRRFSTRAYRRPVSDREVEQLMKFFKMAESDGENFEESVKLSLQAILVSPHFLFRDELQPEPNNPQAIHPVNEFALASRLSYFLWSSMPDEELFAQAQRGLLRKNLSSQVQRMLKDPKSEALGKLFVGQWLQIRDLNLVTPDPASFPDFDESLRSAMEKETELFFGEILREDKSLLDLLGANYTFLNERLARHYGIEGVKGNEFRRVKLKGNERGGLLTQASILTITSNPTRTSPVKRGKWVLDNILGTPPPPPPPDAPVLEESKEKLTGTFRQRMEQHRENPNCASCHARMDPIGFALENFDGIGAWRKQDGNFSIDTSGELVSGEAFKGANELKAILIQHKKADFVRCISEKMLTYALGRGLENYDKCAVNQVTKSLEKKNYKFSTLISEIVNSVPFQMRRGESKKDQLALRE